MTLKTPRAKGKPVNVNASYRFKVWVKKENAEGVMATPDEGEMTGLVLRLSRRRTGSAIAAEVSGLVAVETETTGDLGRLFYYEASPELLVGSVYPIGKGKQFWGIWSVPGELDMHSAPFIVTTSTAI